LGVYLIKAESHLLEALEDPVIQLGLSDPMVLVVLEILEVLLLQ
jgi:hypothetical protein